VISWPRAQFHRLAFLSAAHRRFAAALIRARPSGVRRRFFLAAFAGAGANATAAVPLQAAAQRFLCAAAMRRRAAGLKIRLGLRRERTRPSFRSPAAP
jgi:hypothetical protein